MKSAIFTFALLAAAAVPAAAQPGAPPPAPGTFRPERPYRGLFGGGVGETSQLLTGSATLGLAGYRVLSGVPDDALAPNGGYRRESRADRLTGSLDYSLSRGGFSAKLSGASSGIDLGESGGALELVSSHSASAQAAWQIGRGTRISASQRVGYQPVYLIGLLSSLSAPSSDPALIAGSGAAYRGDNFLTLASTVDVTQSVSRRASLYAGYDRRSSRAPDFVYDLDGYRARAGVRVQTTRYLNVRIGAGYADTKAGSVESPDHVRGVSLDTGFDFNRPLSLSRRTTLTFGAGATALRDRVRETHYVATGEATLAREVGRSWVISLGYHRSAQYVEAFGDPLMSDSVSTTISGLVLRRVHLELGAEGSMGRFGFDGSDRGARRVAATASVVYGLTRYLGLGASYGYFLREYDRGVALPRGFSRHIDSQAIQAYVTLWAPLLTRARRPHAAR